MPHLKFSVQVTTLHDCDDITQFDGTHLPIITMILFKLSHPVDIITF